MFVLEYSNNEVYNHGNAGQKQNVFRLDVQILIQLQFFKQYETPLKTNGSEGVTPVTIILKDFIRAIIYQNISKKNLILI